MWIDTHCHLDAPEFDADRVAVVARAQAVQVDTIVVPAVCLRTFAAARQAAELADGVYALGTHPLYLHEAPLAQALAGLDAALTAQAGDPRLVAVGEIGLDFWVPHGQTEAGRAEQTALYLGQLRLAARHGRPVILHVRRSADALLAGLRRCAAEGRPVRGGIAHAFNGSQQQAEAFVELGFALGFGGAMTFERAQQIRRLATSLPRSAVVLETDAPDIPPQWLYVKAEDRGVGADGTPVRHGRNEPAELPRIAQTLAGLWACPIDEVAHITSCNARRALSLPGAR